MTNTWFQFKQFIIHQDKTAMKVGTDGVLLGAWASCENASTVLDIGTGTGLLALMCAQKSKAIVTAVEIEANAALQASENALNSSFADRIKVIHTDVKSYAKSNKEKFDFIICNPPFFQASESQGEEKRMQARQQVSLNYEQLISVISQLLNDDGKASLICPADHFKNLSPIIAVNGMHIYKQCNVYPNSGLPFKRILLEIGFQKEGISYSEIFIESGQRHTYTEEFKQLTKDFYL